MHPERPFLAVGGVIFNGSGRVLLVQRGNEPWKGWWSIPGGAVETGELLKDAVYREMREETGLEVEALEVVEIFESIRAAEDGAIAFHYVVIDYLCRVVSGDAKASDDASAARWFSQDALPENTTPGAQAVVEKAFARWRQLAN